MTSKFYFLFSRFLIFVLIFGWVFSGWPMIHIFAQEATSTPETPPAATSTSPTAAATSTSEVATSTPQDITSDEEVEETPTPEPPQPAAPPSEPLKERKLNKTVRWDNNAGHFCRAKNFSVNISNQNQVIVELELGGRRRDAELLEVGSLPLGIDITFLNNANYEWQPSKNESAAVLRIINQPGSQKGNFTVPMIYESGASTTICQINVINF